MAYELMLVSRTSGSDSLLSRTEKAIKGVEGTDVKVDRLGRKKLAYSIKKQSEADYFLLNFEAPASSVNAISDKLRLEQEDLLRYLLLKYEPGKKPKAAKRRAGSMAEEPVKEEKAAKVTVITKVAKAQKTAKPVKPAKTKTQKVKGKK